MPVDRVTGDQVYSVVVVRTRWLKGRSLKGIGQFPWLINPSIQTSSLQMARDTVSRGMECGSFDPRNRLVHLRPRLRSVSIDKQTNKHTHTHTHTHPFNGPLSGTTQVSRYQKGKTNLDFTGARDSEWQWHQLGCMQVCTSVQTDNHASTPPLSFLQAGCLSCRPTNSVKSLKEHPLCLDLQTEHLRNRSDAHLPVRYDQTVSSRRVGSGRRGRQV